jgi:O-antigen/teichoic acid export membrane protein
MLNRLSVSFFKILKTTVFKNSFWGISSNIFQNILFSIFFIVVARKYSTTEFSNYVIANTLYAFVLSFSSLGLGQWFIRELLNIEDQRQLINKFFKIQLYIGLVFYVVNIILSYTLYEDKLIRHLSLLIGVNVIFDNVIYVIKQVNIAQLEQRKTFIILTIEAFLKFLIGCLLFIFPIPILYFCVILIFLRLITLNLFIKIGSSNIVNLGKILTVKIELSVVKKIIASNWYFIIIGSVSIIYWRIGNILVSKILTLKDVAIYEISFKLFSMAEILPVIISSSVYPLLIKAFSNHKRDLQAVYKKAFIPYLFFGLFTYTFIYSFSDFFIPFLFGEKYMMASLYCKEMFLTILIFPTALLQANVLIAMKMERLDMIFNVVSLLINLLICAVCFYFFKTLSVVNYAIFFSFVIFHLLQDILLIRKKVSEIKNVLLFYLSTACVVFTYQFLAEAFNKYLLFFYFWPFLILIFLLNYSRFYKTEKALLTKV